MINGDFLGETNAAFDEISINHEEQQQQPVLRSTLPSSSTNGQRSTSVNKMSLIYQ